MQTPNSDSRSKRIPCNKICTYYVGILRLIDLLRGLSSSLHVPIPAVARPNKNNKKKLMENSNAKLQPPQYSPGNNFDHQAW